MIDNVSGAVAERCVLYQGVTAGTPRFTTNGSRIFRPREMYAIPTGGGSHRYAGRAYQQLLCPDHLEAGSLITVPVDVNLTGQFRVTGIANYQSQRLCLRVA